MLDQPAWLPPLRRLPAGQLGQRAPPQLLLRLRRRAPWSLAVLGRVPLLPTPHTCLRVGAISLAMPRQKKAETKPRHLRRRSTPACSSRLVLSLDTARPLLPLRRLGLLPNQAILHSCPLVRQGCLPWLRARCNAFSRRRGGEAKPRDVLVVQRRCRRGRCAPLRCPVA
jgi:hypothetical protein